MISAVPVSSASSSWTLRDIARIIVATIMRTTNIQSFFFVQNIAFCTGLIFVMCNFSLCRNGFGIMLKLTNWQIPYYINQGAWSCNIFSGRTPFSDDYELIGQLLWKMAQLRNRNNGRFCNTEGHSVKSRFNWLSFFFSVIYWQMDCVTSPKQYPTSL